MIVEIFLLLFALGGLSALYTGRKYTKFLSLMTAGAAVFILERLYQGQQNGYSDKFTYDWVSSRYYPVNINLFSTPDYYALIFPFFIITIAVLLFNAFMRHEEKKVRLNGLTCLNLSALILLICSENAIQLLVSACVIDILGFYIINNGNARRKYIFYNLLADMGLFMLFALIWGYIKSIQLADFSLYARQGEHKDFVCILLLLCLFIKSGLFMFHIPLMEWKCLNINRIMQLAYLSTPVCGIVILYKTAALLPLSGYSKPLLQIFGIASVCWGGIGAMLLNNIRQKALYFNMILLGLIYILSMEGFLLVNPLFANLLICGFLLNGCLLLVGIGASGETNVSAMGDFIHGMKLSLLVSFIVVLTYFQTLLNLSETYFLVAGGGILALEIGTSYVLNQIYLGKTNAGERVFALLRNPFWVYGGVITTLAVMIAGADYPYGWPLAGCGTGFLILFILSPFRFLRCVCQNKFIQKYDGFSEIYHIFVIGPIRVLGRVLWLTIDFLIIERTVINFLHQMLIILVRIFHRLHSQSRWNSLFFFILGVILACCSFYWAQRR